MTARSASIACGLVFTAAVAGRAPAAELPGVTGEVALSANRLAVLEAVYGPDAELEITAVGAPGSAQRVALHDVLRLEKAGEASTGAWEPDDFVLATAAAPDGMRYRVDRLLGEGGFTYRLSNLLDRLERADFRTRAGLAPTTVAGDSDVGRRSRLALIDGIASATLEPEAYSAALGGDSAAPFQVHEGDHALPGAELLVRSSRIADARLVGGDLFLRPEGARFFYRTRSIGPWLDSRLHLHDLMEDLARVQVDPAIPLASTETYAYSGSARQAPLPGPRAQTHLGPYTVADLIEVISVDADGEGARASSLPLAALVGIRREPDGRYLLEWRRWRGGTSEAPRVVVRLGEHEMPLTLEPGQRVEVDEIASWIRAAAEKETSLTEADRLGAYELKLHRLVRRHPQMLAGLHFVVFGGVPVQAARGLTWDPTAKVWRAITGTLNGRASERLEPELSLMRARADPAGRLNDIAKDHPSERGSARPVDPWQSPEGALGDAVTFPTPSPVDSSRELPLELLLGLWMDRAQVPHNHRLDDGPDAQAAAQLSEGQASMAFPPQKPMQEPALKRVRALAEKGSALFFSGAVVGGGRHEDLTVHAGDVTDVYNRGGVWHVHVRDSAGFYAFRRLDCDGPMDVADPRFALTADELAADGPEGQERFARLQDLRARIPEPKRDDISGELIDAPAGRVTRLSSVQVLDAVFQGGEHWQMVTADGAHFFRKQNFVLGQVPHVSAAVPTWARPATRRGKR